MSRLILAAVDPYRGDGEPVALGALLARATGAPLLIVGVYPDATTGLSLGAVERDRAARQHAMEGLELILQGLGARPDEIHGAPYELDALPGRSPTRALHELAERKDAAILVVGSTHRGPVGRIVPGSITERVVHGSPCPVAVAPRGFDDAKRVLTRIGVAYAGTPEGELALLSAVALARRAKAKMLAYTLIDPVLYSQGTVGVDGYWTYPPTEADQQELWRRAEIADQKLKSRLGQAAAGLDAEAVVIADGMVDSLVEETSDIDLLCCGSRGYGPLSAVLLGGVTHTLMLKAACPLLLIPRGARNALTELLAAETATHA